MKKNTMLVAVYGSLLSGLGNHHYLEQDGATLVGTHVTEPLYDMFSLGGFPAVQENGNTSIKIEVYEVDDNVKQDLDGLEGHRSKGHHSNFYDVTTVDTPYGAATMYVINDRDFSDERKVVDGDWRNYLSNRNSY